VNRFKESFTKEIVAVVAEHERVVDGGRLRVVNLAKRVATQSRRMEVDE
jgi:hypothetical protein